jgi:archaellum component FlaC
MTNIFGPIMNQMAGSALGNMFGLPSAGGEATSIPGLGFLGKTIPGTATYQGPGMNAALAGGTTWGAALGAGAMGSLGYSTIGAAIGLPQSKYSGVSSGLGAAGMAALGLGGPIGIAAGALFGGALGGLLGQEDPEIAFYSAGDMQNQPFITKQFPGNRSQKSQNYDYYLQFQDVDSQQTQQQIYDYFDAMFAEIEKTTGIVINDVLQGHSGRVGKVDGADLQGLASAVMSTLSPAIEGAANVVQQAAMDLQDAQAWAAEQTAAEFDRIKEHSDRMKEAAQQAAEAYAITTAEVERLKSVVGTIRGMRVDYYNLIEDTGSAHRLMRDSRIFEIQEEFGDLAPDMVSFQRSIWGLEDAINAADAANQMLEQSTYATQQAQSAYISGLQEEIRILESDHEKAKSRYLELLKDELSILQDNLNSAKSTYLDFLNEEISEQEKTASALKSAISSLKDFRQGLIFDAGENVASFALGQMRDVFGRAMGGDLEAFGKAAETLAQFVETSQQTSTTGQQFRMDAAIAARKALDLESSAEGQITEAEEQINLLQEVVDAINETTHSVQTMDQARANYEDAKRALDEADYQTQIDLLTGANELTSSIAEAERQYQQTKTALESSWHQSELAALQGIQSGIGELRAAYLNAAAAQQQAAQQAAAAQVAQLAAQQQAALQQAAIAAQQAAQQAALADAAAQAAAQAAAAQEAARKASIALPSAGSYFSTNPDVHQYYLSGDWRGQLGNLTAEQYALWHYQAYGRGEGRSFGVSAFEQAYMERNPDITSDAAYHWLMHGRGEGREYAGGGHISGPMSGYQLPPDSTFHGDEIIVPLNNLSAARPADDYWSGIRELTAEIKGLRNDNKALLKTNNEYLKKLRDFYRRSQNEDGTALRTEAV